MKKRLAILTFITALALTACNRTSKVEASRKAPREKADSVEQDHVEVENERSTVYTCSIHPEVVKEKPGVCPKCKMTLVKATD